MEYYPKSKIYFDGSHYIAIPHTEGFKRRKSLVIREPKVKVIERPPIKPSKIEVKQEVQKPVAPKMQTKTEIFNDIYMESLSLPKAERKEYVTNNMAKYFPNPDPVKLEKYIEKKRDARKKNILARKTRFIRKAYMNDFNYFATFTYDSKKMDENTFKKKLSMCLSNFQKRKKWRYMGVWERAPESKRLHFHCLLYVPDGTMPGYLVDIRDYDTKAKRMRTTTQNSYFNHNFGRSDFEEIDATLLKMGKAMLYLLKYIEKTGEKIMYSRGLPMYCVSDISDKDVLCHYGFKEQKMILQDDFTCYDEGEILGTFDDDLKKTLKKAN